VKSLNFVLCTLTAVSLSTVSVAQQPAHRKTQLEQAQEKVQGVRRSQEKRTVLLASSIDNARSAVCTNSDRYFVINFGNAEVIETLDRGTDKASKILSPREDITVFMQRHNGEKPQTFSFSKDKLEATMSEGVANFKLENLFGEGNNAIIGTRDFRTGKFVHYQGGDVQGKDRSVYTCKFYQSELDSQKNILERVVKPMVAEAAPVVEVKPEAAPEVKPEVAPEVKPMAEVKPEAAPEVKPMAEVKPEVKPEVAPEPGPADIELDKAIEKAIEGKTASTKPTAEQIEAFNTLVHQTTQQGSEWLSNMRSWVNSRLSN
jgi:hypothetical protein